MNGGGSNVYRWVAALCWIAVAVEGFDVVVLGAVLPSLLRYEPWGLTAAAAGLITSLTLLGMMVGSLTIGTVTDVIGRRKTILICVTAFSLFTALCAVAPSPEVFGALRFLAGLGLGGVLPTAIALVAEYARRDRGSASVTNLMTGYHVGAVLTALLAIPIIPAFGWRAMFVAGALPALVIIPLMLRKLPESLSFLLAKGRTAEAEELAGRLGVRLEPEAAREVEREERREDAGPLRTIFSGGYLPGTLAMFVASFMGLLLVYGLNSWLPEIMRGAGYPLGAALTFLLILNVGAIAGLIVAGPVADRVGSRVSCVAWFALATVFLFLLSVRLPLPVTYLIVAVTGFWVFSSQVLVYALVGKYYPTTGRATAMGWVAGIGRVGSICGPLMGGFLVGAGLALPWGFYAFALAGLIGAIAIAVVPASPVYETNRAPLRSGATGG
ncbi:MFS transporter [Rubrobacter marinus]|uniref:MFS transporter n=1 Tax=Rubrobacter marinus TaxID=2653852 RepID=A0A6G8Q2Q5_9ACTN|nr:MFS transporter [Rubrobacter marinus]